MVRLLDAARHELVDAINYYDKKRAGLGGEFRNETWNTIQLSGSFQQRGLHWAAASDGVSCDAFPMV